MPICGSRSADSGHLTNLNLANNLFTSIPLTLPCLAVNLTRLNMSYNSLRYAKNINNIYYLLTIFFAFIDQWVM